MNLRPLTITILLILLPLMAKASDGLGFTKDHPLVFGLDIDYAPLEYVDKDGMPRGLDVEFTKSLLKRMGIPFTYQPNSWENISGDVLQGRVDLGMMVYSPYRKSIVNYSHAVFRLYYQAIYRKGEANYFDMRSLDGKEVAFMASRPITDTLNRAGARLHVVNDLPQAFIDLSAGRYDAVLCYRYQAKYIIQKHKLDNLVAEDLTLTPREYCYVSRNKALIDSINAYLLDSEVQHDIVNIYGHDVTSQFGAVEVPIWVWYAIVAGIMVFLVIMLVTQIRHSRRLKQEMERAQRSERLKTVFLGNVSHALRTPLNGIIGFSEVLASAPENSIPYEERRQLFTLINENGQQLLYFINELLQLANIETSALELNIVECDLANLMNEYKQEIAPKIAQGVTLHMQQTPLNVKLDLSLTRIVMMHLLTNAATHTRKGCIEVSYQRERKGVCIKVSDTGGGLPESLKDNIFALLSDKHTFVQSETPGLGLSICKAIIDKCHGEIGVHSQTGEGATFWIWLPEYKEEKTV